MSRVSLAAAVLTLCVAAGAQPGTAETRRHELRVLTWNVLRSNKDYAGVCKVIRESGADIVCLQEVTPELETAIRKRLARPYAHTIVRSSGKSSAGYAVLSRYRIVGKKHLEGPGGARPAGWVKVATLGGAVQVLNVHLTTPPVLSGSLRDRFNNYARTTGARLKELRHFRAQLAEGVPALVAGDFNSLETEAGIAYLRNDGGLVDAYRALHPQPSPADITWRLGNNPQSLAQTRIDYIFASPSLVPVKAEVLKSNLSDHRPVRVVFRLRDTPVGKTATDKAERPGRELHE